MGTGQLEIDFDFGFNHTKWTRLVQQTGFLIFHLLFLFETCNSVSNTVVIFACIILFAIINRDYCIPTDIAQRLLIFGRQSHRVDGYVIVSEVIFFAKVLQLQREAASSETKTDQKSAQPKGVHFEFPGSRYKS